MVDTDYITKESALSCFHDWIDRYGHEHSADEMTEYQRIENLPVADVVEVVRCKDCINWNGNDCITMYGMFAPKPNDYCSRGESVIRNGN